MEENNVLAEESVQPQVLTAEALLDHWQGHRKLTRRVIEAFPEILKLKSFPTLA